MEKCSVSDCENQNIKTKGKGKGLCEKHYARLRRHGDTDKRKSVGSKPRTIGCLIENCQRKHCALGYCSLHWKRNHIYGDPNFSQVGPRGGGWIDSKGYRIFRVNGKHVKEHTIVMQNKIGRKLLPNENVHHINGVKDDNRPENLELWVKSQPSGQRVEDLVAWAKEILKIYTTSEQANDV